MEKKNSKIAKDHDYLMKVVLLGNASVGKSSLMVRFADDEFKETYIATIGVDFRFKTINVDGQRVKIQIWDTAGQEKFRTITSLYYKGSDAIVLVYDITDPKSFKEIENYWIDEIKKNVQDVPVCVLLGNKSDLAAQRQVFKEDAQRVAIGSSEMVVYDVSAKTDDNVALAFEEMARKFIKYKEDKRKARKGAKFSGQKSSIEKDAGGQEYAADDKFEDGNQKAEKLTTKTIKKDEAPEGKKCSC